MRKLFLDANLVIYLNTVTGEQRPIIDRFFKSLLREHLHMKTARKPTN
jgi:hypothetical protein